jgi:hypothetical protein
MSEADDLLLELTQEALEAARKGQWDQVIALYGRRAAKEQLDRLAPGMTQTLMEWDQWLITRIREVQGAIQQNLFDIQDQRRKLEMLKGQWGGSSPTRARHLLTV